MNLTRFIRRFPFIAQAEFRWYWLGMFGQSFGFQSRGVIGGWLSYQLTGSALSLGWYIGTWGVAALVFSLVGGALSDRLGPRKVTIIFRAFSGLVLFALYALIAADALAFWHLLLFNFLNGVASAFEYPARTALVPRIISPRELTGAFGLIYAAMSLSSIVGPASVGLLMDHVSAGSAILLTGTIMLLSAFCILPIRKDGSMADPSPRKGTVLSDILDGVRHIWQVKALFFLETVLLAYVLLVMPHRDILPAIAADVLGVGATGLGLLNSAASVGGLLGNIALSSLTQIKPRGRFLLGAAILQSIGLVLFGQSRALGVAILFLGLSGFGHGVYIPLDNTLLQTYAAPSMSARVVGMNMFMWALGPIGTIVVGAIADLIGAGNAVSLSAMAAALAFILITFAWPQMRDLQ